MKYAVLSIHENKYICAKVEIGIKGRQKTTASLIRLASIR